MSKLSSDCGMHCNPWRTTRSAGVNAECNNGPDIISVALHLQPDGAKAARANRKESHLTTKMCVPLICCLCRCPPTRWQANGSMKPHLGDSKLAEGGGGFHKASSGRVWLSWLRQSAGWRSTKLSQLGAII